MGEHENGRSSGTKLQNSAANRLAQVDEHLGVEKERNANNNRRSRRRSTKADELPADHSDVLSQIKKLRNIAANPDTSNRGYVKQKQAGKLWVRERVDKLLDAGSFMEVGSISGTVQWKHLGGVKEEVEDYVPSNNVQGDLS